MFWRHRIEEIEFYKSTVMVFKRKSQFYNSSLESTVLLDLAS